MYFGDKKSTTIYNQINKSYLVQKIYRTQLTFTNQIIDSNLSSVLFLFLFPAVQKSILDYIEKPSAYKDNSFCISCNKGILKQV